MALETPKISTFLIALVWVSFLAGVFTIFISNLSTSYNLPYNENQTATYNKMQDLSDTAYEIQNQMNVTEKTGLADIIGSYFSSGYKVLIYSGKSLGVFVGLTNTALSEEPMNMPAISLIKVAIVTTVIILVFVGIIMSSLIKRET